jgi:hypothetical protein
MNRRGGYGGKRGKGKGCGKGGYGWSNHPRPKSNTPQDRERRYFDKITKSYDAILDSTEQAVRFLQAAVSFGDSEGAPALLYKLADEETVKVGAMRKALEFMDMSTQQGEDVLLDGLLPLLRKLGHTELDKPVYSKPLLKVLQQIYLFEFRVVAHIKQAVLDGLLDISHKSTILWFLAKLALAEASVRKDPDVLTIAKELGGGESQLRTILNGTTTISSARDLGGVDDVQQQIAGGRHNNDFTDFRSIQILPTAEEFMCASTPFLPLASEPTRFGGGQGVKPAVPLQAGQASLLDRQFRLLRQDMIGAAQVYSHVLLETRQLALIGY